MAGTRKRTRSSDGPSSSPAAPPPEATAKEAHPKPDNDPNSGRSTTAAAVRQGLRHRRVTSVSNRNAALNDNYAAPSETGTSGLRQSEAIRGLADNSPVFKAMLASIDEMVANEIKDRFSKGSDQNDRQVLNEVKAELTRIFPWLSVNHVNETVNRLYNLYSGREYNEPVVGNADVDEDKESDLSDPPDDLKDPDNLEANLKHDNRKGENPEKDPPRTDPRVVAASRIAAHLTRHNEGRATFEEGDILEVSPSSPEDLIKILKDREEPFAFHEYAIRGIMRDPYGFKLDEEKPQHRHQLPPVTHEHPTRQYPRDFETFAKIDDEWYVIFKKEWTDRNGKKWSYRQVDRLETYNPKGDGSYLRPDQKDSTISHPGKMRTFIKHDQGRWELEEETEAAGKWRRVYDKPPRDESRKNAKAEPKFIARKFHLQTGAYLEQYKYGQSWDDWQRNIENFNINDMSRCRDYNRWIQQVLERSEARYTKRQIRHCWSKQEMEAARRHFNDLIRTGGLIKAHLYPQWEDMLRKCNEALRSVHQDDDLRNINGVSSFAERDIYVNDIPRLGTHEWREFGKQLRDLERNNRDLVIPDNVLYPRPDPIPMDDIAAKAAGSSRGGAKTWDVRRGPARIRKLSAKLKEGKLIVTDVFGGEIVRKFGLMDHVPGYEQEDDDAEQDEEAQAQETVTEEQDETSEEEEEVDEDDVSDLYQDGDENQDDDEDDRPRKKRKRGTD